MGSTTEGGLVTVVICVYNAGEYLRSSLVSVLEQTYANLEVIVVDDGSTDGCLSYIADIRDPRVTILRQQNRGKPAALNLALSKSHGVFYAIHDADDLSHPRRIERQVQCLTEDPSLAAVFCGHELILDERRLAPTFGAKSPERCRKDIENLQMPGHDPTVMYRSSLVAEFKYDEELPIVEGYDHVMRVGERFPMKVVGECLYSYRIHLNTVTKRDPSKRQRLLRLAVEKLHRRRGMAYDESSLPPISTANENRERDNDLVSHFMRSMVDLRRAGEWQSALRNAAFCIGLHPFDLYYYRPALYAAAPLSLVEWYRGRTGE